MARNSRRVAMLTGLLVVVAAVVITSGLRRQTTSNTASSSNSSTSRSVASGNRQTADSAEAVKIEELKAARPDPGGSGRNPFQFKPRAAPPPRPTPSTGQPGGPGSVEPAPAPPPPAGPPPMGLKFIGLVDAPAQGGKLAVLSDGRSVYYGHEGDLIDGRFKIVRIGVESIEMMYADGRGRQTIRLSGQ